MRFDFAYGRLLLLLTVMGMGPKRSWVEVTNTEIHVRMGWAFQGTISRVDITAVERLDKKVISIGVHGWAGKWLVNGAGDRLVRIDIDPETKARSIIPVRLRELTMSLADGPGFIAATQPH